MMTKPSASVPIRSTSSSQCELDVGAKIAQMAYIFSCQVIRGVITPPSHSLDLPCTLGGTPRSSDQIDVEISGDSAGFNSVD